jgi:hypothetical protein
LVLKNFLKTDYRGVAPHLEGCPSLVETLALARVAHQTTLQRAARRLLARAPARQLLDAMVDDGSPLHMLSVFVHDLQAVVGQWSTGAEKTSEPTLLRRHLEELLAAYPMLRLFTRDAIYAQRPLAELVCGHGRNYLFQIEANQGDTLNALEHCFAQATTRPPAAHSTNKRGLSKKPAGYGLISTTPTISAKRSTCSAAA